MVIVDSNVWIDYLKRPDSRPGAILSSLLEENQVAIVGPVLSELLQGARSSSEFARVLDLMQGVPYIETSREAWIGGGRLAVELRAAGTTTPLLDLVIAAVALEGGHEVFTLDPDFERVPGLRLYKPNEEAADA